MAQTDGASKNGPADKPPIDAERINTAVDALLMVLNANRIERWTYLTISVVSFIVLLVIVVYEVIKGTIDTTTFIALFGTTGVVGVCVARVLEVWKDCMKLLSSILLGNLQK